MCDLELIDSHCHLIFENFEKDLEDVVLRFRSKGVKKLVHACSELKEIPKLKKMFFTRIMELIENQKLTSLLKLLLPKSKKGIS